MAHRPGDSFSPAAGPAHRQSAAQGQRQGVEVSDAVERRAAPERRHPLLIEKLQEAVQELQGAGAQALGTLGGQPQLVQHQQVGVDHRPVVGVERRLGAIGIPARPGVEVLEHPQEMPLQVALVHRETLPLQESQGQDRKELPVGVDRTPLLALAEPGGKLLLLTAVEGVPQRGAGVVQAPGDRAGLADRLLVVLQWAPVQRVVRVGGVQQGGPGRGGGGGGDRPGGLFAAGGEPGSGRQQRPGERLDPVREPPIVGGRVEQLPGLARQGGGQGRGQAGEPGQDLPALQLGRDGVGGAVAHRRLSSGAARGWLR